MTKKMSKNQKALSAVLDALGGMDEERVTRVLRAAGLFYGIEFRKTSYWPYWVYGGSWGLSSNTVTIDSTPKVTWDNTCRSERFAATQSLLDASTVGQTSESVQSD